jgi:gas vesicle protein
MEFKTSAGFGTGLLIGAVIGGVIALLYAPQSGKKTRKFLKNKATEFVDEVKEEASEVVDEVKEKASGVMDTVKGVTSKSGQKGKATGKAPKS